MEDYRLCNEGWLSPLLALEPGASELGCLSKNFYHCRSLTKNPDRNMGATRADKPV